MNIEEIKINIKNVISSLEFCKLGDDDDIIFEEIESLSFIIFISALEKEFNFEFDNHNLHPDKFKTVNAIAGVVAKEMII